MTTSREIRLKSRIVGAPVADNFRTRNGIRARPALGEVQVKNLWMSVDPYMRGPHWVDRTEVMTRTPHWRGATPAREIERLPRPILLCTAGARRSSRASVAGRPAVGEVVASRTPV